MWQWLVSFRVMLLVIRFNHKNIPQKDTSRKINPRTDLFYSKAVLLEVVGSFLLKRIDTIPNFLLNNLFVKDKVDSEKSCCSLYSFHSNDEGKNENNLWSRCPNNKLFMEVLSSHHGKLKTKSKDHCFHNSWPSLEKYDMKCLLTTLQTLLTFLLILTILVQ